MIPKKEFYFIRHGQTDQNILEERNKKNSLEDPSLNQKGQEQAVAVEPLIASLPIKTICASPLKRVQETKDIVTAKLKASSHEREDFGESSAEIWKEITRLTLHSKLLPESLSLLFAQRVQRGLNEALLLPSPCLIISHAGVHWIVCYLLGIENHEWMLENCGVVHFFIDTNGKWAACKLT